MTSRCRHIHDLGMFLPMDFGNARNPAQIGGSGRAAFANTEKQVSILTVAHGSIPTRTVMCHYRYPSPTGRSDVPKIRPPALFPGDRQIWTQLREFGRFSAGDARSLEHSPKPRVIYPSRINRGVTERCAEQKSRPLRPSPSALLRLAGRRSENRHLWAAQPVSAPRRSPMAMSGPVRSSAQRQTSPIASRTPAHAARCDNLIQTFRVFPAGRKSVKPRSSTAAAGFLRAQLSRNLRGQEPGQEPKRD